MTDRANRRRTSSSSEHDPAKRTTDFPRREYGDTYISGAAKVHIGDRIYLGDNEYRLQQEAQRLQNSLAFPHMHERYESLTEAADGTYQWIFNSNLGGTRAIRQKQMTSFFDWFRTGAGAFWISGKPGAGKSTLMKYLAEHIHCQVTENLPHALTVFSFFFWIGGSDLQRNKIGCMRSLLWQALQTSSSRDLAITVCQFHFKGIWTEQVLRSSLSAFLNRLGSPVSIFLDGLDESDDHDDILHFLDMFLSAPGIKLCVSSRPETTLVDTLSSYPSLKLQHLNSSDIKDVIRSTFTKDHRFQALSMKLNSPLHRVAVVELSQQIEEKAEGVFLWVILVIKDLLRGITQRDDIFKLSKRLTQLPNNVVMLYEDMLRRAQPDREIYKCQAALYLSLAAHRQFSLIEFCFAINEDLRKDYLRPSVFDRDVSSGIAIDCQTAMAQVCARTAGLLEVRGRINDLNPTKELQLSDIERSLQNMKVYEEFIDYKIHFVHRTALDFLKDTAQGQSMLESASTSDADISQICFETRLIASTVLTSLLQKRLNPGWASDLLECAACGEEVTSNCLQTQGQDVLHSLLAAGLLVPDTCDWIVARRMDSMPRIQRWSCPSSSYASIDLLPVLIELRKYHIARTWLDKYNCQGDSTYVTMLLVTVLRSIPWHEKLTPSALVLIQALVDCGANLGQDVRVQTGEMFRPLGAAMMCLHGNAKEANREEELNQFLCLARYDLLSRFWPSCAGCHQIWYTKDVRIDRYFEFWGCFRAAEIPQLNKMKASVDRSVDSGTNLKEDQIFILVDYRTWPSGRVPLFCAVSHMDSQLLISKIRQYAFHRRHYSAPGIWSLNFPHLDRFIDKDRLASVISTVQARSPTLTFAAALRHLDKSQEMIEKFYEYEAKRMGHRSEDERARWRHWFWGDEVPMLLEDNIT